MTAFWVVGIGVNLCAFALLVWWAVKNWPGRGGDNERDGNRGRSRDGDGDGNRKLEVNDGRDRDPRPR